MTKKLPRFEKYSVAPSPSRDYYGLKVLGEQVILYIWKITHGPHLSPITRTTSLPDFPEDKVLKDEISFAFGPRVLDHIENLTSRGSATLLTLPNRAIERLVRYLSLNDIASLLRVSRQSNEIFASNAIWEVLYKRLKGTSKLLAMERELGSSQGFKKLARSQHVRATAKKSSSQTTSSSRAEPLVPRSASVSLAESTYRVLPGKQSKLPRALLAGAGESLELHPVIVNEGRAAGKIGKTRVAEEERKKYLKSLMFESETGGGSKEAIERRTPGTKSPRSRFKRRAPGGTRSKSIGRATGKGSAKKPASDVKEWRASDDSDDSGMSYLMKRYLQTSDEVGRKFDACGRMARSTRDSGVQVDLAKSGSVGRKPVGKIAAPVTPTSRGAVPTRLKTLKKT